MIGLTDGDVRAAARIALGPDTDVDHWHVEGIAYRSLSPATGALGRVRCRTSNGRSWSTFVKLIQHVRHSPLLARLPDGVRDTFADRFPWQQEMDLWRPSFDERCPEPGSTGPFRVSCWE